MCHPYTRYTRLAIYGICLKLLEYNFWSWYIIPLSWLIQPLLSLLQPFHYKSGIFLVYFDVKNPVQIKKNKTKKKNKKTLAIFPWIGFHFNQQPFSKNSQFKGHNIRVSSRPPPPPPPPSKDFWIPPLEVCMYIIYIRPIARIFERGFLLLQCSASTNLTLSKTSFPPIIQKETHQLWTVVRYGKLKEL